MNVATARISYAGPGRFDVTRKSGGPAGWPFAPSRELLDWGLQKKHNLANLQRREVYDTTTIADMAARHWARYRDDFIVEMRRSYRANLENWERLLAGPDRVLVCYCTEHLRCHRTILARELLPKLGANYVGELEPNQTKLPIA